MQDKFTPEHERHAVRLAKVLSKLPGWKSEFRTEKSNVVLSLGSRSYRFNRSIISSMERKNLLETRNAHLKLTETGVAFLKQNLNPDLLLASAQNKTISVDVVLNNQHQKAQLNTNESPLLRLYTRKTKTGRAYISMAEFQAGEQLRKDFERGQLQPKISANLEGVVGSSGRSGFADKMDIADFAMDARKRVGRAIEQLGPELSGVTLDICCFLKGFEIVERDRKWPPRSAKLMLKTGLALLARHYGISGYENSSSGSIKSWGTQDYRPTISR